ncbi:FecR domain-containing protein [Herbaspirillum sp. alder98]|uniref:FecR family protein n=1 Tax=Herbaspirillum sp. alder98 TaxID=2913096 RepID=UPI001CD8D5AF|nr:FecR domain-containing protein [Herbaspirillum sp. alder98]MCA1324510.1 FecR domain-containing protein [Herbaspirillum sp. alder98]
MLNTIITNRITGQAMNSFRENRSSLFARQFLLWTLALALLGTSLAAQAQQVVGQVTHLSGVLTVRHADGTRKVLGLKSAILQGDTLITERETYTRVKFVDNAEIVLRPGSEVSVDKYVYDEKKPENDSVAIGLVKGGLRAVTGLVGKRNHEAVNFNTPTATIGIRGTNFGAIFCQADCGGIPTPTGAPPAPGLYIDVATGAVLVANGGGQQLFNAGQFGFVPGPNQPPVIVPPASGLQFVMPPTISQNSNNGNKAVGATKGAPECVVQ